ncbi:DUF4123 domain-containing protein [Marinobacter xiaoshiensis]|uniref:DUF4123 domain-containing protein n=1 Tax=Marinobacter xiaoshiensis TaxID=3073652 RepID=A0ABU2HKV2_9GAMM|nr:DUF4123 domain-containing protein [Marinobacter sp. F60267]MDS1311703.1 DUF4123 domain-containing protein [Marinobacter sp. F60267]
MMPKGFLDSGRTFLLIDGAKVENLAEAIYRVSPGAPCDSLYRGTELADMSEISPWLVEAQSDSSLGIKCFDHYMHRGVAIAFQTNASLDELVAHLRGLLIAKLATGDDVVFRFYDPEIARQLLSQDPLGENVKRILGPCHAIAVQDRRTGEWERFQNNKPSQEPICDPFVIQEGHLVAMEHAAHQTALRMLELHTAQYFPQLLHSPSTVESNWAKVADLMSEARQYGLSSTRDIALYINTIGWLGCHAFEDEGVQTLWQGRGDQPERAMMRIAEYAEKHSREEQVNG